MLLSPDPPRDTTSDGNNQVNCSDIQEFIMLNEEDVMGEGEHELDFSSHESDLTDDDDDEQANDFPSAPLDNQNGNRVRAHYQLLIPFVNAADSSDQTVQEFHGTNNNDDDEESDQDQEPSVVELAESGVNVSIMTSEEISKREITMNSEKVETIKNVMKNFSLPPTSIPVWAKEMNDEVWKTKLISKLEDKTDEDSNTEFQSSAIENSKS